MPIVLDGTNGITQADQFNSDSTFGFKNRIINGDMGIDQRNAGASFTPSSNYTLDRWRTYDTQSSKFTVQQNAGSVTPPVGFTNYLGITSTSAYSLLSGDYFSLFQRIEGFNVADLGWGTANAKTITISFWVRSSLTGTFGGNLTNASFTRSYPFSYTISLANTWEYKTITIAGDTTGTWLTTNGSGIEVQFAIGVGSSNSGTAGAWTGGWVPSVTGAVSVVGTNGATLYITGVQLEVGSTATSFDYLDYGRSLIQCQRYFQTFIINSYSYAGNTFGTNDARTTIPLLVSMRTAPTGITIIGTVAFTTAGGSTNGAATFHNATINQISILSGASGYAAAGGSSSLTGGGTIQVSTEL